MEKAIIYKSVDGSFHESEDAAKLRDEQVRIHDWYVSGNEIPGSYAGSRVEWEDLVDWLHDNESVVKTILGWPR